jgi:actin-related protein
LDDKHQLVKINGQGDTDDEMTQEGVQKVFDITTGEYDVAVSSGPSFATRRAENMSFLVELVQYSPNSMQFVLDKIVGLMDFPESKDIKERLEKLLPPALQSQDQQKNNPQMLQQELTKAHGLIQQLTQTLQNETQLADKEAMKFKIATLENQTELVKQQRDMQHEGSLTAFKAEIAEIKAASDHSKALLQQVHQHILDTGAREHQTAMDITQTMAQNAMTPQEQQGQQTQQGQAQNQQGQ